jgi:SAM-dependent methyltransferase/uncharacterized protein YbaR (Trm112 family)
LGASVARVLACPRCGGRLDGARAGAAAGLACVACGVDYPAVGEVPCLVPDPGLWRARWGQRTDHYLTAASRRIAELNVERGADGMLRSTRERLIAIMAALSADRDVIARLLAPLQGTAAQPQAPSLIPMATAPSADYEVLKFSENLFRDWVWGRAESDAALDLVRRLLGAPREDEPEGTFAGTVVVLGAGAGRLAVDLHRTLRPAVVVALDINPLPLLVAAELVAGGEVTLHEFPVGPHGKDGVALRRAMRCPFSVDDALAFVIADGLRPPLAPASVDVVVTPWFIDAADVDPRVTAAAINRVLRPGGRWLNFGPLRFNGAASRQYTIDEIREIVLAGGFALGVETRESVPYFASPDSGSHRTETIFGFAARKTAAIPAVDLPAVDPRWITDPRAPIPRLPDWEALRRSAVFTNGVIAMIDGRRSIAEIAAALGKSWGVDPATLEDPLRAFLSRLVRG